MQLKRRLVQRAGVWQSRLVLWWLDGSESGAGEPS